MEYNIITNIPFHFEKIDDSTDERFQKVRLYIAHVGLNLHNSIFSKALLTKMIPSLDGIPITGFVSEDAVNDLDFNGHEERYTVQNGDIIYSYLGRAYGFIGADHNARFETKEVNGEEVEFLVCEGRIWNKFSECKEIFDRDTVKSQSMELLPSSIKGKFEKDGHYHFADAKFEAACILGDMVKAAMTGSTIEKFSTQIQKSYSVMMEDYNKYYQDKGGKQLTKFSWSASQLREELSRIVSDNKTADKWGYECSDYYYVDHLTDDGIVIVYDCDSSEYIGFPFTIVGDVITVDFATETRYKNNWTKMDATELETMDDSVQTVPSEFSNYLLKVKEAEVKDTFTASVSELETKNAELDNQVKEFETKFSLIEKDNRKVAVDELFENFSKELTEEEVSEIKSNNDKFSLEDLKLKLFALVGMKKAKFSKTSEKETVKFSYVEPKSKNKDDKDWADLVKK